jgi:hypothetical protein
VVPNKKSIVAASLTNNKPTTLLPPTAQLLLDAYVSERDADVLRVLHPPEGQEIDLIVTHSRPVEYPLSLDDEGNQHNLSLNTTVSTVVASPAFKPSPSSGNKHAVHALSTIADGQQHHNLSVITSTGSGGDGGGGMVMEAGPSLWAEDTLLWLLDDNNPTAVSIVKLALAEQEELRQTSLVMESFLGAAGVCAVAASHNSYWEEVHHEYRRHVSGGATDPATASTANGVEKNGSQSPDGLGSTERYLLKPEEALEVLLLSVGSKEMIAPQMTTDAIQGPRIRNLTYPSSQPPTANYGANREDLSGGMDMSTRKKLQQQLHKKQNNDGSSPTGGAVGKLGAVGRGVGEDCSSITRPMLDALSEPTYALHSCPACARMMYGPSSSTPPTSLGKDPSTKKLADDLHDKNCIHSSYKNYGRVAADTLREEILSRSEQGAGGGGGNDITNGASGVGLGGTLGLRGGGCREGLEGKASTSTKGLHSRSVLGGGAAPPQSPPSIQPLYPSLAQHQNPADRSRQESQLLHLGALHRLLRVDAYFATHPPSTSSKNPPQPKNVGVGDGFLQNTWCGLIVERGM